MPRSALPKRHSLLLKVIVAGTALAPIAFGAAPAAALSFDFTTIPGDTLSSDQSAAFATAASAWSSYLSDPITVDLQIGFANLGTGILGSTSPSFVTAGATVAKTLLAADATSANDQTAVASLPNYGANDGLLMTSAEARAIGFVTNTAIDGSIEFSSNFAFSTARDANGGIAAGTYDLIGIAEHEIGHALGFISSLDAEDGPYPSLLDEFRFSAPGARSATDGATAYFSIDDGATPIAAFSQGGSGNYQASHWLEGTLSGDGTALMNPALAAGAVQNIQPLDLTALDVIGYDLTSVPEPASAAILAIGLAALRFARKRRLTA